MNPPALRLRDATAADSERVFGWANDPLVRAQSFSTTQITRAEHERWFAARLSDPDTLFFIGELPEGEPVGYARFAVSAEAATISVALGVQARGRGLSAELIRNATARALGRAPIRIVHAEVKASNAASLRAFRRAGYRDAGARPHGDTPVVQLSFTADAARGSARALRILYVGDPLAPGSGVGHKMLGQAREWQRHGHTVWFCSSREPAPITLAEAASRLSDSPPPRTWLRRARGEANFRALYPWAALSAARALDVDLVYARELPDAPGVARLMRAVPTVLEINGDALRELQGQLPRLRRRIVRHLQIGRAAGVVFVSDELRRACTPAVARSLVLANACPEPPAEPLEVAKAERPTLAWIGAAHQAWNGFDKLQRLAELAPELSFIAIGRALGGPPNLKSYPRLPQAEAERILCTAHVGIGPLALHRKHMFEASPLKSRAYLSLGLPVIQAYRDTDLTEADGCVLELSNTEDTVEQNLQRLRVFARRCFEDPSPSRAARSLALGRLSARAKEAERLGFLRDCLR